MNKQREVIYGFRNEIIHGDDVRDRLMDIMEEVVVQKGRAVHDRRIRVQRMESAVAGRLGEFEFPARHARSGNRQGRRIRQGKTGGRLACSTA